MAGRVRFLESCEMWTCRGPFSNTQPHSFVSSAGFRFFLGVLGRSPAKALEALALLCSMQKAWITSEEGEVQDTPPPIARVHQDMTDEQYHLTAGRRRKHKNPAVAPDMHDLTLPSLPNHLRADATKKGEQSG